MKNWKRLILMLTAALLLSACGGKEKGEENAPAIDKETVYREEADFLEKLPENISTIQVVGETFYIDEMIYDMDANAREAMEATPVLEGEEELDLEAPKEDKEEELSPKTTAEEQTQEKKVVTQESDVASEENHVEETEMTIMEEEAIMLQTVPQGANRIITGYDFQGKQISRVEIPMGFNESGGGLAIDSQGNFYSIITVFATYEGDDTKDKVYLKSYDKEGKEVWAVHLNEKTTEDEYYFANQIYLDADNQLVVDSARGIEIYDLQGQPVKLVEKPEAMDCNIRRIRENQFALAYSNGEKAYIQTVNTVNGQLGEKIEIPFNYYRYSIQSGKYYDLYLSDEYGVYGYNIGDLEPTKLMDYISSDFGGNTMLQLVFLEENTFLGVYYGDMGMCAGKFTKVPASEIVDKIDLTLGCYYLEPKVKQRLIQFNKDNPEYKIHIMDYSSYDTMNDYSQGLTKLNTDIISGKVPDIMLLNQRMPVSSYISKGLFADYNEFIEKDPEFKKEDYLPNIFEALSNEDGLYQLAPSFMVSTFAAKTKDVGKEPGWTMEEAIKVLNSKPEGTNLLSEMTSANILYYVTWIGSDDYINWETGECFFDTPGFQAVLDYAKTLPKEIDYTAVMDDESYWNEMEAQYRNGKTIMSMCYLSSFRDYQTLKQGTFGEEITFIGFPTDKGIGAGLNFNINIAISSQSKNQEAAWEFVKGFFSEEYQDSIEYEFPVRISSLEKLEEKAWNRPYYEDEEGNREEYDDVFYLNGMEVVLKPLTKEETSYMKEYLGSVTNVAAPNEDIYNIILEETESFFNGQKTVNEVTEIIQSRVKIYVNENR